MSKFFYGNDLVPKYFKINKGSVRLTSDNGYLVKYPNAMDGHIRVQQNGETIEIELDKDFPNEEPVVINLKNLNECNINLTSGVLDSNYLCPIMNAKVQNGTLSAKLLKDDVAFVKAKVEIGVLNNHSNLDNAPNQNNQFNQPVFDWNPIKTNVELIGNGAKIVNFEVGSGVIDFSN